MTNDNDNRIELIGLNEFTQAETANQLSEEAEKVADTAYAALTPNKKENQMSDPVAAARREYDNADKAFNSNPTDANLASYEIARKALLLVAPVVAAVDEDQDERPFPDSDEAIRALQDVAEAVDELKAECYRLRAELKTALAECAKANVKITRMRDGYEGCCPLCETVGILNVKLLAERDEARQLACEFWVMDGSGYSSSKRARESAIERGWDCFKEETP